MIVKMMEIMERF